MRKNSGLKRRVFEYLNDVGDVPMKQVYTEFPDALKGTLRSYKHMWRNSTNPLDTLNIDEKYTLDELWNLALAAAHAFLTSEKPYFQEKGAKLLVKFKRCGVDAESVDTFTKQELMEIVRKGQTNISR